LLKDDLAVLIKEAIENAVKNAALPEVAIPEITVERTVRPEHGDYASNAALKLKRSIPNLSPVRIAETIKQYIPATDYLEAVEIAQPGFLNFRLTSNWLSNQVINIIEAGQNYGDVELGNGQRTLVEFVSSNPTGPVTIASARGAALGDALANILHAAGYYVEREFYVNDAGSRMDLFYTNCWYYYQKMLGKDVPPPAESYPAAEFAARMLVEEHGDKYLNLPPQEGRTTIGALGIEAQLNNIKIVLQRMGVEFNTWFREQTLFDNGAVKETLQLLRDNGQVAEREGAVWFASSALGQEKDNVLIRSNGQPTYFISDIAYHRNKFAERGFQNAINVWGADHQGHIPRMKAAMNAVGLNPDDLTIIVMQMVTINGTKMKKTYGNIVTLEQVLEEVGADATRFFLISRSHESKIDFDLDLAVKQSNENPVFYVQYAHARCSSLFRQAAEKGFKTWHEGDVSLLSSEADLQLIRQLTLLPETVEFAARSLEPHHLTFYAQNLAGVFHSYYHENRIIDPENPALSNARLLLVRAVKLTLAKTLTLMGMTAPEEL
jgi:arginyl-tRNA synthetase